jgi:glycerol-3-phosphate dehydrogenase
MVNLYNVIILESGILGFAIARELSRYNLRILVVERKDKKEERLKRGVIFTGYEEEDSSWGELLNYGFSKYRELKPKLRLNIIKAGSLTLGYNKEEEKLIDLLYKRSKDRGIKKIKIFYGSKIRRIEPHISKEAKIALLNPDTLIIDPDELEEKLYQNAKYNQVEFLFLEEIKEILNGELITKYNRVRGEFIIDLQKDNLYHFGYYLLLGKEYRWLLRKVINRATKKIFLTPTIDREILIGPYFEENIEEEKIIENLKEEAFRIFPKIESSKIASIYKKKGAKIDFSIEVNPNNIVKVRINDLYIVTLAPYIGEKIAEIMKDKGFSLKKRVNFFPKTPPPYRITRKD